MWGRLDLLALAASVAACGHGGGAPPSAGPVVDSARASSAPGPDMPRPDRRRLDAAVTLNATCVSCHAREAAEWMGSRHRRSDTNAAYQTALSLEPSPFCRKCHAPESDPTKAAPPAVSDLGVGCVTCHVTDGGAVLAAPRGDERGAAGAPHALRRSGEFAGAAACARCHEFEFPAPAAGGDGAFMQTTVREHDRSSAAARPCAACHMQSARGRRSHAFASVRHPGWLRSELHASAERDEEGELRVTLVQRDPGHGFPTGDLFRRLEVGCEVRGASGDVLDRDVRYLARHFELVMGRPGKVLVGDDRVFDRPVVVALSCAADAPNAVGGQLSWWVSYQRVATVGADTDPAVARIESEVRLHAGTFPWGVK